MRLSALALMVFALAFGAEAQPTARVPRMGWLDAASSHMPPLKDAFRQSLRDLGYDRLPALAAELVRLKVDLIVAATGAQTVLAAKHATTTIPIVMVPVADPAPSDSFTTLRAPAATSRGPAPARDQSFMANVWSS